MEPTADNDNQRLHPPIKQLYPPNNDSALAEPVVLNQTDPRFLLPEIPAAAETVPETINTDEGHVEIKDRPSQLAKTQRRKSSNGNPKRLRARSDPVLPIEKQVIVNKDSKLHQMSLRAARLSLFQNSDTPDGPNMDDKDFIESLCRCKSESNLEKPESDSETPGLTKHALYKESLYTGLHMLGKPTERYPCTSEDLCMYAHLIFPESRQEQTTIVEHVMTEPFPLIIVNCKLRRAEGLPSRGESSDVNPYCIISMETAESIKENGNWQKVTHRKDSNNNNKNGPNLHKNPNDRLDQLYNELPRLIKTSIQYQSSVPVWDQRFQCLGLRPSADLFTIEVWDHNEEKSTLHALKKAKQEKSTKIGDGSMAQLDEAFYRGKRDNFLGAFSVKLEDIPCEGGEVWYNLNGVTHQGKAAQGKVLLQAWLTHAYRHGRHFDQFAEPKLTLAKLWHFVLSYESKKVELEEWDGLIPPAASGLLFQYGIQTGVGESSQGLIRWKAYAKHSLGLLGVTKRLLELSLTVNRIPNEKLKDWRISEIETTLFCIAIEKICPVLRNHLLGERQERVQLAVEAIQHSINILKRFKSFDHIRRINILVTSYLKLSVLDWYEVRFKEAVQVHLTKQTPDFDAIELYAEMIARVNKILMEGMNKWSILFWMEGFIDYMPIMYIELQKMLIFDVEDISWRFTYKICTSNRKLRRILLRLNEHDTKLCQHLFLLYHQTQEFVNQLNEIPALLDSDKLKWLKQYHLWFRPVLVLWLGFTFIRACEMTFKSIKIDNVVTEDEYVKTSSSALDTRVIFIQLTTFWTELNWPDISENFVVARFLMEVIGHIAQLYAALKRKKLEREGYFDTVDRFDVSDRLCIALNNIETVKGALLDAFVHFNIPKMMSDLQKAIGDYETPKYDQDIQSLETESINLVDKEVDKILYGIRQRVKPEIRNCIEDYLLRLSKNFHLNPEEGLDKLFAYLEDNFITLHLRLLPTIFVPVLLVFWKGICEELFDCLPHFPLIDSTVDQQAFFSQMNTILDLLISYFKGGGIGLNEKEINCEEYLALKEFIDLFHLDTPTLIGAYFKEKATEQFQPRPAKYGILKARASFWHAKLTVEVISGTNLVGSDPVIISKFWPFCKDSLSSKSTSDCMIELDLVPEKNFANAQLEKTAIKWNTTDPVFEESFTWQVSKNECEQQHAVLRFTVKDFDLVSKNDFLGEAFVLIDLLPGVHDHSVIPQPMNLIIRSKDDNRTIQNMLKVLKCRHWDPIAVDFLKQEEVRFVKPLES